MNTIAMIANVGLNAPVKEGEVLVDSNLFSTLLTSLTEEVVDVLLPEEGEKTLDIMPEVMDKTPKMNELDEQDELKESGVLVSTLGLLSNYDHTLPLYSVSYEVPVEDTVIIDMVEVNKNVNMDTLGYIADKTPKDVMDNNQVKENLNDSKLINNQDVRENDKAFRISKEKPIESKDQISVPNTINTKRTSDQMKLTQEARSIDVKSMVGIDKQSKDIVPEVLLTIKKDENSEEITSKKALEKLAANVAVDSVIQKQTQEVKQVVPSPPLRTENIENMSDSVIKFVETAQEGQATKMVVKLEPEALGKVELDLVIENGKISAKVSVENEQIRTLINDKINDLAQSLEKQNIIVNKISVVVSQGSQNEEFNFEQGRRFNQNKKRQDFITGRIQGISPVGIKELKVSETKDGVNILA